MKTHVATITVSSSGKMTASSSHVATLSEYPLKGQLFNLRWGLSACASSNGKAYLFGGYLWSQGIEGFFADLYEIDLVSGGVRRVSVDGPSPCARFGHSLAAEPQSGLILLFGGRNSTESFSDLWAFDPARSVWVLLCPGGAASSCGTHHSRRTKSKKSTDTLKSPTETSKLDYVPGGPDARSWQSLSVWNGCAYVYGGWDHANRVFNDLWMFDLASQSWSRLDSPDDPVSGSPPHGRSCHQAAVWNDHLYIFGGLRDGDAAVSDMWKYGLETRLWQPVEVRGARPGGRTSAAAAVVENSWIIHGGLSDHPKPGVVAQDSIVEFNFYTNTWINRSVMVSEGSKVGSRRYGHAVLPLPNSYAVILLGGAERYAAACPAHACRVDLLPSQAQVGELASELTVTARLAQLNRDRLADVIELVQNYDSQIRQLKAENTALSERLQTNQEQLTSLHQQYAALQGAMASMQQTLGAVEQVIPMMRSVGAAIASFGNATWPSAPGSSGSLGRPTSFGLTSAGDLRFPTSKE